MKRNFIVHTVLLSAACLVLPSIAAASTVIYDDTSGAAAELGYTPLYESSSYSGYSPAQEFTATATGTVTSFTFAFYNTALVGAADPLTVSLWTTTSANTSFGTELGSWNFSSEVVGYQVGYDETVNITGGPLLTSGVLYGIELSTSSTATATDWLANANVNVPQYSVCNIAFYCTDPNGQTPTANSTYFVGTEGAATGPQALFSIDGTATLPSATPEPSSLLLLATGALSAAGAIRRRVKV